MSIWLMQLPSSIPLASLLLPLMLLSMLIRPHPCPRALVRPCPLTLAGLAVAFVPLSTPAHVTLAPCCHRRQQPLLLPSMTAIAAVVNCSNSWWQRRWWHLCRRSQRQQQDDGGYWLLQRWALAMSLIQKLVLSFNGYWGKGSEYSLAQPEDATYFR